MNGAPSFLLGRSNSGNNVDQFFRLFVGFVYDVGHMEFVMKRFPEWAKEILS